MSKKPESKYNIFISHATCDSNVVDVLKELIETVSMDKICVWHSSDIKSTGGFKLDDVLYDSILKHIRDSQAVIALITPNSKENLWVMFESGFAEASINSSLMVVKFMLELNDVPNPLSAKHINHFSTIEEVQMFLDKILKLVGLEYRKDIFKPYVKEKLAEMKYEFEYFDRDSIEKPTEVLSKKMDSYFNALLSLLIDDENNEKEIIYDVMVEHTDENGEIIHEYIKINPSMTVSDVLDCIYFTLNGKVEAYKYLETWIIKEKGTDKRVVISDVQDLVPAMMIFRPKTSWVVEFLKQPYIPDNTYNKKNNGVKMESLLYLSN